jgi:hypothetical protein
MTLDLQTEYARLRHARTIEALRALAQEWDRAAGLGDDGLITTWGWKISADGSRRYRKSDEYRVLARAAREKATTIGLNARLITEGFPIIGAKSA